MRTRRMGAAVGVAVALVVATPALAGTTTTFTITGSSLSISAPASASLGSAAPGGTLTAQLGAVTVTDNRAALASSWTASVQTTTFTTGTATAAETIATSAVKYWSGAATATTGLCTFTPGQLLTVNQVTIGSLTTAFSCAATIGDNSATWNPTVVITVPAAAVAGSYTGTITHSVA